MKLLAPYLFAFALVFFFNQLSGQTKVSSIDSIYYKEDLGDPASAYEIVWNDEIYLVSNTGPYLQLSKYDIMDDEKIFIDIGFQCGNYKRDFKIHGDDLFISFPSTLLRVNLASEQVEQIIQFENDHTVLSIEKDDHDGVLMIFGNDENSVHQVARVDLLTEEVVYKTVDSSRKSIFANIILTLTKDSILLGHDLRTGDEIDFLENGKLVEIWSNDQKNKRYYREKNGTVYELNDALELVSLCTELNHTYPHFQKINNNFLYKLQTPQSPILPYYEIIDLTTCSAVGTFNASLDKLRFPNSPNEGESIIEVTEFGLGQKTFIRLDHDTKTVVKYTFPLVEIQQSAILKTGIITMINESNEVMFYELNFETDSISVYPTGLNISSISKIRNKANDNSSYILTGVLDLKNTIIELDSIFTETGRRIISEKQNYGLTFFENHEWSLQNETPYLSYNQNILKLESDNLEFINNKKYHEGLLFQNDTIYGYVNRNDSTFFNVDVNGNLIFEEATDFVPYAFSINTFKVKSTLYRLWFDGPREVYPNSSSEVETLSHVIERVYYQFSNKVLVSIRENNISKLAFFDGDNFEIISDLSIGYPVQTNYRSLYKNKSIVTRVFNTAQGGSYIISLDEKSGDIINSELIEGLRFSGMPDNRNSQWKVFTFRNWPSDDITAVATNGVETIRFDLTTLVNQYGNLHSFYYANDHLFFVAQSNIYAVNRDLEEVELTNGESLYSIQDVIFKNEKYYCIHTDYNRITIRIFDTQLLQTETIFETEHSHCFDIRDNYFIESIDSSSVLLVLNNDEYGKELWQLSLEDDEVSIINDMNEGVYGSFENIEFIFDEHLYFTATADFNTQLYKIKIDQSATISSVEDYPATYFTILPNPTSDIIKTDIAMSSIRIFNVNGIEVFLKTSTEYGNEYDVSCLRSGLYFIEGMDPKGKKVFSSFIKI